MYIWQVTWLEIASHVWLVLYNANIVAIHPDVMVLDHWYLNNEYPFWAVATKQYKRITFSNWTLNEHVSSIHAYYNESITQVQTS